MEDFLKIPEVRTSFALADKAHHILGILISDETLEIRINYKTWGGWETMGEGGGDSYEVKSKRTTGICTEEDH